MSEIETPRVRCPTIISEFPRGNSSPLHPQPLPASPETVANSTRNSSQLHRNSCELLPCSCELGPRGHSTPPKQLSTPSAQFATPRVRSKTGRKTVADSFGGVAMSSSADTRLHRNSCRLHPKQSPTDSVKSATVSGGVSNCSGGSGQLRR